MIINDFGKRVKANASWIPQANAIFVRVLQTIGNNPRTFKAQNMVLDDKNSWNDILAFTMFAFRAIVHTTTQYAPDRLVFERDLIII